MWPSKIESKVNLHFLTQVRDVLSDPICVHDTHSEAKEMEISEFGAEKGLLQGQAERNGGSCSKVLNLNSGIFQEKVLKYVLWKVPKYDQPRKEKSLEQAFITEQDYL